MVGLKIKKARNGQGLYATRSFRAGSVIFRIEGKRINYMVTRYKPGKTQDNTFRYGPETYITPEGHFGVYLNHSCEPNAKLVKTNRKLYIQAARTIRKDEEVVFDYSTNLAKDDIWSMKCNCGAKSCRKKIASYDKLPKDVLEDYLARHMIPQYILNIKG